MVWHSCPADQPRRSTSFVQNAGPRFLNQRCRTSITYLLHIRPARQCAPHFLPSCRSAPQIHTCDCWNINDTCHVQVTRSYHQLTFNLYIMNHIINSINMTVNKVATNTYLLTGEWWDINDLIISTPVFDSFLANVITWSHEGQVSIK